MASAAAASTVAPGRLGASTEHVGVRERSGPRSARPGWVLSPFDDYPIHQVAAPIAHAGGGHPDFYDRFWFNGYTDEFFFAVAFGTYRNRGVIDAAFSVVSDGQQRSVFASGRAPS